ncbi:sialate O-acetylesterase [Mucilaginibacter sp. dw_454]|uniref:sialate O-acetylesterase n=1 Tax=Mucilaginibacter sp. dw_454 TaxID=2720079 RepID=UPI001BD5E141|nr:sialate O-acetylesterase [Mucilaginibacter sp. dw_454]
MKVKWLLILGCLSLMVDGCKKDAINSGSSNQASKITVEKFSISNEFQNNMVVQRDKPIAIWGKATTDTKVDIRVSWNPGSFMAVADQNGNWSVNIPATVANASPQTINCHTDTGNSITLTNILVGDVWLCAGQSNMVMEIAPVDPFLGVTNYAQEIQAAQYPLIRFQTIQQDLKEDPLDTFSDINPWQVCSPATAGNLSAVAYFFARKLHTSLNVPVGIIVLAVDGSSCSDWLNNGQCYNGMISPLLKLAIKGFIWYQGENDQHIQPVSEYTVLNKALIQRWRDNFAQETLPFYLVQLAPFAEDFFNTEPPGGNLTGNYLAKFREAQANVLSMSGTGMAVTMDVGDPANHHPRDKKQVGERLALLALKNTYNLDVACYGPKYLSYSQSGDQLIITYVKGTADGLSTINNSPLNQFFFVAGADEIFYNAPATINGNTIVLTIPPNVSGPVLSVRYAFTNAPITNLQNAAGLPAEPFRTDSW